MRHSHIHIAQEQWKKLLKPGDGVIDATCGNGQDSLYLAEIVLKEGEGELLCLDIQKEAIKKTKNLLKNRLPIEVWKRIAFAQKSHQTFPKVSFPIKLIVYNLGYLPGGNKEVTTLRSTTLKSLENALNLVQEGGGISVMCYPGHEQGKEEEKALIPFVKGLDPLKYRVLCYRALNQPKAPFLIFIKK